MAKVRAADRCRAAEAAQIASATYFTVVRLLGRARYYRAEFSSLTDARAHKVALGVDEYGRRGMVYAVTATGDSVFVE